jgi:isopentenyldiphosphate isomerase
MIKLQTNSIMNSTEYFPIVTEEGEVTGKATRKECHSGSFLLHPVVHLHVFNSRGEIYLQKRALNKDIQPDKWDTSVGGHVEYGEEVMDALKREVREELGIKVFQPAFIIRYKFISKQEAELVNCFYTIYDGLITPDPIEISEGKFWKPTDIESYFEKNVFTPNFEYEYNTFLKVLLKNIR